MSTGRLETYLEMILVIINNKIFYSRLIEKIICSKKGYYRTTKNQIDNIIEWIGEFQAFLDIDTEYLSYI